jgi:hypothetical protein
MRLFDGSDGSSLWAVAGPGPCRAGLLVGHRLLVGLAVGVRVLVRRWVGQKIKIGDSG